MVAAVYSQNHYSNSEKLYQSMLMLGQSLKYGYTDNLNFQVVGIPAKIGISGITSTEIS